MRAALSLSGWGDHAKGRFTLRDFDFDFYGQAPAMDTVSAPQITSRIDASIPAKKSNCHLESAAYGVLSASRSTYETAYASEPEYGDRLEARRLRAMSSFFNIGATALCRSVRSATVSRSFRIAGDNIRSGIRISQAPQLLFKRQLPGRRGTQYGFIGGCSRKSLRHYMVRRRRLRVEIGREQKNISDHPQI